MSKIPKLLKIPKLVKIPKLLSIIIENSKIIENPRIIKNIKLCATFLENFNFLNILASFYNTNYRLAPRRMWPGHFDDVKEVIEFTFDNSDQLGIDKNKIILSGDGTGHGCFLLFCFLRKNSGSKSRPAGRRTSK